MTMNTPDSHADIATPLIADRRRSTRIEVVEAVKGHIRPHNIPITLLNVSHGGFLMKSPIGYAVDDQQKFRFTITGEIPMVLRGRIAHVMRVTANGTTTFVIGVEFIDVQVPACNDAIALLIRAAGRQS